MRIAIVDDDPIVCQSLETILTATGTAEVLWTANDGDAAVRRYFETPASRPDVLLIDIQMPGTSGLDAAREILATDPAARILFLTTFADQSYIAQAMGLGAKGYLIKQDVAAVGPALQAVMAGQVVLRRGSARQAHRTNSGSCRFRRFQRYRRFHRGPAWRART